MKKLLLSFVLLLFLTFGFIKVNAATFDDVIAQNKPSAILIYAPWADNIGSVSAKFNSMQTLFADKYIFAEINIATDEAKSFNKTNYIYPNLPYILLYKDRGRISRYLNQDCINSDSCLKEKMELFAD